MEPQDSASAAVAAAEDKATASAIRALSQLDVVGTSDHVGELIWSMAARVGFIMQEDRNASDGELMVAQHAARPLFQLPHVTQSDRAPGCRTARLPPQPRPAR
ncbi:hypothetical protein OAO87_00760 [bacterium]|nr:hypothetical protein [bacterium]